MTSRDALKELRRESLDIYNRLHSIEQVSSFVNAVHDAYPGLPILPNLRCGAWYTEPSIIDDEAKGAYFKSTDGHYNAWKFSLRRPNLHLLPIAVRDGGRGLILVDSTRAGKRFPDALSKTVPIWCAVVNRAVLLRRQSDRPWDVALHTPPVIPAQEASQISSLLDAWANGLATSSYTLPDLPYPLRPIWITPASSTLPRPPPDCIPVICVSASAVEGEATVGRRMHGFAYVQGAGDDHELWGMGLTPELFWAHRNALLSAERASLPQLVTQLVGSVSQSTPQADLKPTPISRIDSRISICAAADLGAYADGVAYIIATTTSMPAPNPEPLPFILNLPLSPHKKAQSNSPLPALLPRSTAFATAHLRLGRPVCFVCDDGRDVSVGLALAVLGAAFDDDGRFVFERQAVDKQRLRTRLEWIIASRPEANPSRATLKRVNEFLMSAGYRR
ncbi:Initiator tRNA phosphoribosyl transferase [Mycena kentingensis (nom. inval.)]|nr:Initiator tRNA phosphoribosyl transferase [Mycena kentingensis (nom. inval.)]